VTQPEPRWVPRLVIEAVYLDQIREHGGLMGIRDENALESALARARQRWTYEPESDLARLAADYAFGVCSGHPFRDGNKRIAFLAAVIFLGLNGLDLIAPDDEVVETMLAVASGKLDEEAIAAWIRSRTLPLPGV
jgi:death-on-curing protein